MTRVETVISTFTIKISTLQLKFKQVGAGLDEERRANWQPVLPSATLKISTACQGVTKGW